MAENKEITPQDLSSVQRVEAVLLWFKRPVSLKLAMKVAQVGLTSTEKDEIYEVSGIKNRTAQRVQITDTTNLPENVNGSLGGKIVREFFLNSPDWNNL